MNMIPNHANQATENYFSPTFNMFEKFRDRVKEIRIEDFASELTELRPCGNTLRGICPIHGGDNDQAFAVHVSKQRWRCFRCDLRGDVIDLAKHVEGCSQMWEAMIFLTRRYNIEIPSRPTSWCRRQREKAKIREGILENLTKTYQRRFFRVYGDCALENIEDEAERKEEARRMFEGFYPVARVAAMNRLERRRG